MDIRKKPVETKMYYCESRYYVPQWCRWLNGDSIGFIDTLDIHGMNLFAYCSNNPVMWIDPTGHSAILIGLIIAAIIGVAITAYNISQTVRTQQYINENYTGSSRFWYTLSNYTLGYALTSIISFDENNIIYNEENEDGWLRIDFSKNKNYNFFTSFQYTNALKKKGLPKGRTVQGIWFEFLVHHFLNFIDVFGLTSRDNQADMGPLFEDDNAQYWELPFISWRLLFLF